MQKQQQRPLSSDPQPTDPVAEWADLMKEWDTASAEHQRAIDEAESSPDAAARQQRWHARLVTLKARIDELIAEGRERRQADPDSLVVGTLLRKDPDGAKS